MSAGRLPLRQVEGDGATDGQVPRWNATAGRFEPGEASSAAVAPLTTSVGGTPALVWDDHDELVLTEVVL